MRPLPPRFVETRESLRAVACYVVAPARKAETGRIGLRPTGDGFGTPPLDGGRRIVVRGDQLIVEPGGGRPLTTLRAAAEQVGVELSRDPGVGSDLPPFAPDAALLVDEAASLALGDWYALGAVALDRFAAGEHRPDGAAVSDAQLWPEHFDLAVVVTLPAGAGVNVGFSPGDGAIDEPYCYVGPHDVGPLSGPYWNAPFGAVLRRGDLAADTGAAVAEVLAFVGRGLVDVDASS